LDDLKSLAHHAGHVWGLDGLLERMPLVTHHPSLRPLFA
jgi:hypothetical protein